MPDNLHKNHKKSTSSLNSFWRYCKEIANLLFSVIWACLATHLKWYYQLEEPFDVYLLAKDQFILHVFLEILQRYCKLVLRALGMPGIPNPKWYHTNVESFRVYLLEKNQLHALRFSADIAKTYKLRILGTLGMPGCTHPKW